MGELINNEDNEILASCGEILGNGLALKVADNKCPTCSSIMHVEIKPGIAIIYINKICPSCGYKFQDFI